MVEINRIKYVDEILQEILGNIEKYYTDKIKKYGATPKGVDWKDEKGQFIRFEQLSKIFDMNEPFSVADIGCGYGKFVDFLDKNFSNYTYFGYDLSSEMVSKALELYSHKQNVFFRHISSLEEIDQADYVVASGIFNVKMHYSEAEWLFYIFTTLELMNKKSIKGFAFNMLTKYSDREYMKEYLYYADPCFFFDYCKKNFSKKVALIHDYELYEFTILVRK
ncbi:MAG: class I SAM-dependent methyltransferase [Candidatus Calescibacterium sp.]|jgi:cyclopropane fatty-acyl-phospholipid synthase-like methyltransferase